MDNTSDKKPLLSANSSHESTERSASNKNSKETKSESKKETNNESKKESMKTVPTASGGPPNEGSSAPNRIVRPTVQARPFSTKTKKVYWVFTIIHLILLLAVLFGISYGLLQFVFAQTKNGPLYWGTGSFIGGVPSIMFEPTSKGNKKREIKFNCSSNSSYAKYVERLTEVTIREENADQKRCHDNPENNVWMGKRTNEFCTQKVTATFPDDTCNPLIHPSMGYDKAKPCLLIRLTKILGFFPMSEHQHQTDIRPENNENSCDEKIKFNCSAKHFGEKEEVVRMVVPDGISFCHFPFWNQKGYTPPYIMIRPKDPLPKGKTVITCSPALKSLKKLSTGIDNKIDITIYSEEKIDRLVPTMIFEPAQKENNVFKFNSDSNSSFMPYVERLREVMKREVLTKLEKQAQYRCTRRMEGNAASQIENDWSGKETMEYCNQQISDSLPRTLTIDSNGENKTQVDQVCNPESGLMGYNNSTPCILIGLTKMAAFFPVSDKEEETGIRPSKKENACKEKIKFNCDANLIGEKDSPEKTIELLVPDGISFCHFPYWNQKGYIAPFIMIRPKDPLPMGKTVITCSPTLKSLKKLSNGLENKIEIIINKEN